MGKRRGRSRVNVRRLVTEYSKREMKVLSSWVVIKTEKPQILEIHDVGRREDTRVIPRFLA